MIQKLRLVALSGVAMSGKDTFFNLMNERYPNLFVPLALGDYLKKEVDDFCRAKYGCSAFTQDPEQKKVIRPTIVAASKDNRAKTNGKYYTNAINLSVKTIQEQGKIPVVKDIRYAEYSEDEVYWALKNEALLIHITRYNEQGNAIPPANEDEFLNDPIVKNKAHFQVYWRTTNDKDELMKYLDFLDGFVCSMKIPY